VDDLRNAGYIVDEPGFPAQTWVDNIKSLQQDLSTKVGGAASAVGTAVSGAVAPPHAPSPPQQSEPGQVMLQTGTPDSDGRIFPLPSRPDNAPSATYHSQGGSDLMAPRGTPVAAMQGGKVVEVFQDKGDHQFGGNAVLVHGSDGLDYYYAHFDQPTYLKTGDTVVPGQQIGLVGNSGNAYKGGAGETHLHIGIGHGISSGVGSEGGLGENFNAQALLTTLENGVAPKGTPPTTTTGTTAAPGTQPAALGGSPTAPVTAPLTLGANQPAKPPLVVQDQAATPIQSAADVLGTTASSALDQARQALQQAQDALSQVAQGAQDLNRVQPGTEAVKAVTPILGGAQQAVQNAAQGVLGAAQDVNRLTPGTTAVNAAAPVLGAAAPVAADLVTGGITRRFNENLQGVGQDVLGAASNVDLSRGVAPVMGEAASALEATAKNVPANVPVLAGLLDIGAAQLRQPGVLDALQTRQELNDKYANTPGATTIRDKNGQPIVLSVDSSVMTPEDKAKYDQTGFIIGSISGQTERAAERPAGRAAPEVPTPPAAVETPRTPIGQGGLGTPRYEYPTGSTPQVISDTLRTAAERDPTGVAHVDSQSMGSLPSLPRQTLDNGKAAPAWQAGIAPHLDDLRYAQDVGMNQSQWYSKFAQAVSSVVGDQNVNEFRTLFGITSQQTPPTENLQYTLGLMRMAREFSANGTDFTVPNIKQWIADNPRVTSTGTEGAKWKMNADQFKKVAQLYTTGEVKVATNAKTSSYASNILSALMNRFDPNSTMDTWMAQIFNYKNPNRTASSDQAFQAMRTVVDHLAGETGQVPHQAQAAMWFAIKGAKDFAASRAASPTLKAMVKDFTNGRTTLRQVLDRAGSEGAYDNPTGTWEQVSKDLGVASELAKLQPHLDSGAPRPAIADSSYLYYPGKGTKLAGAEPIRGAAPRVSGVVPEATRYRAAAAERQAAVAETALPQTVRDTLRYDPETRQFGELRGIPHEVQGDQILVPGGNMDTLHYVAARVHDAAGSEATPATLYTYRPESPETVGWQLTDVPAGAKQQLLDDLRASGVGHQELNDGTIGVNALPVRSVEHENAIADAAQRAGATVEELRGHVEEASPGQSAVALDRYGARYGTGELSGVPEPGRGVAGSAGFRATEPIGRFFTPTAASAREGAASAGGGLRGPVEPGGFRAPVTPDDLNVRTISQQEARQLVGPAYDPSTRTTQRPPAPGEEPRRLEDVQSNPHLLREPGPGETPMTMDERRAHQDTLEQRYQANTERLAAIDEQLRNPTARPERPPWAAGFTNDQVATMAAKVGRSPYEPLWWEKAGLEAGSGEVREMVNEGGVERGRFDATRTSTPAELRAEQRALQQDQLHLEAAGEQQATAPDNARFVRPPERAAGALPFGEGGAADPGAQLAQEVVTSKGRATSDVNQVTATRGDVTGRGIVNPAEVVTEAPSEATRALMPNLNAIGKDMPEVVAQIQKSVDDNPALWEHYKQGTITFDSLKNDLAARVGMTKEDWLKTKVGQAFNDQEMVALQAAMIEEQARQTDMAKSILSKGGVDNLTPEELAYSITQLTQAQSLAAVAKGAGSTVARSLNARKVSFTRQLASDITAQNERRAAQRVKAQAARVATRAGDLLDNAKTLDQQKAAATAAASRPARPGAPRTPQNIIDQIANAYDELDRYNAMSLHEKADVFDKLKAQREAAAAARASAVRGAPEELLSALKQELKAEQDNFAKRKNTWETMAFMDSKTAENAARERAAFRGGLYIEQQRRVAQNALKGADTEINRAFDSELKRRGQQSAKAQKLLESLGGTEVTKDVLKNYLAALSDPNPMVAAKFLQSTASMSNWKRATVVRLAGLVSSPITQMVNIGGNVAGAMIEVPTRGLVVGIDALRAAATGGERQAYAGEILPMLKAYGPGFLGQWDNAYRVLKTGFTPEQLADPTRIRGAFSRSELLNAGVEAPLRLLGAADQLFRGGAMAAHSMRVATRQAIREGFSGPQVAGRAASIVKNLEDYPELAKEAADATARQVYQERRAGLGGGNKPLPDVAEFGVKQVLPFYQTPMNITAQGAALSPFGFTGALQSSLKARGMAVGTAAERTVRGRETLLAEERAARAIIGSAILGGGIALGSAGMLTGSYPIDPKEASTLPQGWRPWSLRITSPIDNNTYYLPMQNFNAAGFPLAMASILTDPQHRGKTLADPDEQLNAVTAIGRYVLDNTFLQGLSDVVNTLHDPKSAAQKFGEGLAASYGPYSSLGREMQRIQGVATRNPHNGFVGLWEALESNYPGASANVPEATTPLGEPRTQGATGIARVVPYRYDIERDTPLLQQLRESGVGIPTEHKSLNYGGQHIDLTEDEQDVLKRQRGEALKQYLDPYVNDPKFQNLSQAERNRYLTVLVSHAVQYADHQFLNDMPGADLSSRLKPKTVPDPYYLGDAGAAA